jgi:hypothetical protein
MNVDTSVKSAAQGSKVAKVFLDTRSKRNQLVVPVPCAPGSVSGRIRRATRKRAHALHTARCDIWLARATSSSV